MRKYEWQTFGRFFVILCEKTDESGRNFEVLVVTFETVWSVLFKLVIMIKICTLNDRTRCYISYSERHISQATLLNRFKMKKTKKMLG